MRSIVFLLMLAVCLIVWECNASSADEEIAQLAELAGDGATPTETRAVGESTSQEKATTKTKDGGPDGDGNTQATTTTTNTPSSTEKYAQNTTTIDPANKITTSEQTPVSLTTTPTKAKSVAPTTHSSQRANQKDSSIGTSLLFVFAALITHTVMAVAPLW